MRIVIFIDGNNFYFGLKKTFSNKDLGKFNFKNFCNWLVGDDELVQIFYYNASLDRGKNKESYIKQQKFFAKLKKIPKFNLILCKLLKRLDKETGKVYYVLKEDDIHMAVDLVKGAYENFYDKGILVSGDGDFVPAVLVAREKGKEIMNACFKKTASTNLKKNCDGLVKLNERVLGRFFDED